MVVNTYSKCIPKEKRDLWRDFLLIKASHWENVWRVHGDFNFFCTPSERVGSDSSNQ